jgi:Ca2+-binding EF-hand superfamily protein
VAKRVNLSYSEKELQAMLESVDQDKDGAISKSEFITFMNKKRKLE